MIFSALGRQFNRTLVTKLVVAGALVAAPAASFAGILITVGFAPPILPVYVQPVIPGDGYLWNPGYWAYAPSGYYWIPGVWVQPPSVGVLWTPPYWGFAGGLYGFHEGYWGPHVGFYGGVNYGFGFGGVGFGGGRWDGGHFAYNTAVMNVGGGFHGNVYVDKTVIVNNSYSHTSYNGGPGGIQARPTAQETTYSHENHIAPTAAQQSHYQAAQSNKANFATANGGHPAMAAQSRPGSTEGAVAARGAAPARPAAAAQPHAAASPAARPTARPEAARPEAARPEAARPEAARPEQARPAAPAPGHAERPQPQSRPQAPSHPQPAAHPQPPKPQPEAKPAPKDEHPKR